MSAQEMDKQTERRATRADLDRTAAAALGFLEDAQATGTIDLTTRSTKLEVLEAGEAMQGVLAALRDAKYIVPGEATTRETPLRDQTPRGSDRELAAVSLRAGHMIDAIAKAGGVEALPVGDFRMGDAIAHSRLGVSLRSLTAAHALTTEVTPEVGVAREAAAPSAQAAQLPHDVALALYNALEAGHKVLEAAEPASAGMMTSQEKYDAEYKGQEAQLVAIAFGDAKDKYADPDKVTVVGLRKALKELEATPAQQVVGDALRAKSGLPGMAHADVKILADTIQKLHDLSKSFVKRQVHDDVIGVVHERVMDGWALENEKLVQSGAWFAVATSAGKTEYAIEALNAGRTLGFASIGDMMSAGKFAIPGTRMDEPGRARESMTVHDYNLLSENERKRSRAVVVRPGEGWFYGLLPADPAADAAKAAALVWSNDKNTGEIIAKSGLNTYVIRKDEEEKLVLLRRFGRNQELLETRPYGELDTAARKEAIKAAKEAVDGHYRKDLVAESQRRHETEVSRGVAPGALAAYVREMLTEEDGKPNHRFRTYLANLKDRAIVFPGDKGRECADVLRGFSDLVVEQNREKFARDRETVEAKFDKLEVVFDGPQLQRFADVVLASGSETKATMVKRGGAIRLEHPEGTIVEGALANPGILEKAADGYRLAKVDVAEIATAAEAARGGQVSADLHADRPVGFRPTRLERNLAVNER